MPQCHTCQHATTGNHKRRTRPINLPCHQDASVCVDLLIFAATYEDHISAVLILAEPLQILNQLWKTGQGRVTVWCTCAHRTAGNPSVSLSFSLSFCVFQSLVLLLFVLFCVRKYFSLFCLCFHFHVPCGSFWERGQSVRREQNRFLLKMLTANRQKPTPRTKKESGKQFACTLRWFL